MLRTSKRTSAEKYNLDLYGAYDGGADFLSEETDDTIINVTSRSTKEIQSPSEGKYDEIRSTADTESTLVPSNFDSF